MMNVKLPRRQFLHLAAGAAALPFVSRIARAQVYPTRPVRIVVGFPAGGTTDIVARLVAQWMSERLGQQFVIENRPGASTNIATEAVARAPADGYMLLTITSTNTINASIYDRLNFDLNRDFAMVAGLNHSPLILEVHPSVPVNSVPEFIAYAKASPGKLSMASFGTGSISHVAGELFKMATGLDMLHVPYRGSAPMVTDLMGAQVQAAFDALPASIEYIRAGKLRALAATTSSRLEVLPDVQTVSEFLPGYEARAWAGIGAPKNTPPELIDKLSKEISAALSDSKIKARLADLGGFPMPMTSAEFGKFVAAESEKWAKVVKFAGIKPE
jgi:tripartite-type tricarboxylate transporter receptor subunit TctC